MTGLHEQRVKALEDLIADIPQMVSLRLEGLTAARHETAARIGIIDKPMAMMPREMRDVRGDITRQLVEQDTRLGAIDTRLEAILARLPGA
ncbi:MAG: hypothetical protein AB1749_00845 [Pseudomonadota bacterium]